MRVEFLSPASEDLAAAIGYLESERPGLGASFLDDVEHMLGLVTDFPSLGTQAPEGTRRVQLRSFPYAVVYRATGDVLQVVAIEHHARMPGFWKDRL